MEEPRAVLEGLWRGAGGDPARLADVTLTGRDPILPTRFRLGSVAAASIGAAALAADELWRLRAGRPQAISVDMRAAAVAFRSERYLRVEGRAPAELWQPLSGFYRGGDGRFIQLHCNFRHHVEAVLRVLGCADSRPAVEAAIATRKMESLEADIVAAGGCAGMVRRPDEWRAHPQAVAVAALPLLEILRIGESAPEPAGRGSRPLAGVRVLDLTRIIAGPVCGRTLAEHGADVLLITGPHLPSIEQLVIDTGRGKRSAQLDLRQAGDAERLRSLIAQADVFCQGYRPDALAGHGFAPEEVARLRPGIVYVTLCAYGHTGPWRARRGFDSLVQSVSGIAHEGGDGERPRHLPAQAIDHATGYLAAFGAMMALARRAREGGSYLVRCSLAQTGHWITGLGRTEGVGAELPIESIPDLLEEADTPVGRTRHVRPAAVMSETPPHWAIPAVPLGTHTPAW